MYLFAFFVTPPFFFFKLMELSQASLTEKQSSQSHDALNTRADPHRGGDTGRAQDSLTWNKFSLSGLVAKHSGQMAVQ